MKSCEYYQGQLLDHLYGLLEAEQSLALIEHAGSCDDCRAALQRADGQRRLLGIAAISECPEVVFEAPAAPAPAVLPPRKPIPLRARKPLRWGRYAAAAAVLLAVSAVGIPAGQYVGDYWGRQREVADLSQSIAKTLSDERALIDDHDRTVAAAKVEKRDTETSIADLTTLATRESEAAIAAIRANQLYMVVTGQQELRPGTPSEYTIKTLNMNHEQVPSRLDVRILDLATNKPILERKDVASDGTYSLPLSADEALKSSKNLALEVVARSTDGAQRGAIKEKLTLGRTSYLTQLVTDKPIYQPGETVRFRSLTLDRFSLKPAADDLVLMYTLCDARGRPVEVSGEAAKLAADDAKDAPKAQADVRNAKVLQLARGSRQALERNDKELKQRGYEDPKAQKAADIDAMALRGLGAGEFVLPENLPTGEYALHVEELGKKFSTEKRKLTVARYRAPTLNKELKKFDKESYLPGEQVEARVQAIRVANGQPLADSPLTAVLLIDDVRYTEAGMVAEAANEGQRLRTDARGEVVVRFRLPKEADVKNGDARLEVKFDDAPDEPLVRSFPVLVDRPHVEFFPEGGDLIAGVPNRVYFHARTPLDRPAALRGQLVDAKKKTIVAVHTLQLDAKDATPGLQQGMGVFEFTPAAGGHYQVVVEGTKAHAFPLPEVKAEGVALAVPTGVTNEREPIQVRLHSAGRDRQLLVCAYCRGALLAVKEVNVLAGKAAEVQLNPGRSVGGVYRVTAFERLPANANSDIKPVAERLVFRTGSGPMKISLKTDKPVYGPGDKVTLTARATGDNDEPLPAVLMIGVVDKSVLRMADAERTARSMPTHFLLTSEIRRPEELEYADVLLTEHARAAESLDLLLGTQGWRRFLESDPERFRGNGPAEGALARQDDVRRLLVATGALGLGDDKDEERAVTSMGQERKRIREKFAPRFKELDDRLVAASNALDAALDRSQLEEETERLHGRAQEARTAYAAGLDRLREFDRHQETIRQRALLFFGAVLLVAGGASLIVGLGRQMRRALPVYLAAAGAVGICGLVVVGTYLLDGQAPASLPVAAVRSHKLAEHLNQVAEDGGGRKKGLHYERFGDPAAEDDMAAPRNGAELGKFKAPLAKQPNLPTERAGASTGRDEGRAHFARPTDRGDAYKKRDTREDQKAREPKGGEPQKDVYFPTANQPLNRAIAQVKASPQAAARPEPAKAPPSPPPGMAGPPGGAAKPGEQVGAANGLNRNGYNGAPMNDALRLEEALDAAFKKVEAERKGNKEEKEKQQTQLRQVQAAEPCVAREYAHRRLTGQDRAIRFDFTETIYWHPALVMPNGEATVTFDLNDAVTSFQVVAAGHTVNGQLGGRSTVLESRKPFTVAATVPTEVKAGAALQLPVSVANTSSEPRLVYVSLDLDGRLAPAPGAASQLKHAVKLAPGETAKLVFPLQATPGTEGTATVTVVGTSEPFGSDGVRYSIKINP